MDELVQRVEEHVRRHELIAPGGEVLCLVSGGADSTCLWSVLRELGYRVSALHVAHGLRGSESDEDALFCARELGAEVVHAPGAGKSEAELRDLRYAQGAGMLRATGHTLSDQVETILYRLVTSGNTRGIKLQQRGQRRAAAPVSVARGDRVHYCADRGLPFRVDSSNAATVRGVLRGEVLPALEQIHPAARENILRALDERRVLPQALADLLDAPVGSKRVDLGGGVQAVREHDRLWLERGPVDLDGQVEWGAWRIVSTLPGLRVRGWRAGDRLAGRSKKIQDVFVDAKIPRSDREGWPLVVRGDEVVAVPGIVEVEGVSATHVAD